MATNHELQEFKAVVFFMTAMEERAKLRAERKALIDEKKRRLEEEKLVKHCLYSFLCICMYNCD